MCGESVNLDLVIKKELEEAAQHAAYRIHPQWSLSADDLRSLHQGNGWLSSSALTANPEFGLYPVARLEGLVRSRFANYITNDYLGTTAAKFMSEASNVSVEDFTRILVRATALLGVDQVAAILSDWFVDRPIGYKTNVIVRGIDVSSPLKLAGAVELSNVDCDTYGMFPQLPSDIVRLFGDIERRSLIGTTRIAMNRLLECRSPLFKPESRKAASNSPLDEFDQLNEWSRLEAVCQAFSLVANASVVPIVRWHDYGDLMAFNTGKLSFGTVPYRYPSDWHPLNPTVGLSESEARSAWNLVDRLDMLATIPLGLYQPTQRWMNSKRTNRPLEDRLIELRIALEALFLDGNDSGELSYRLALRAALRLGPDQQQRLEYFDRIRRFYNLASRAVHGGFVKDGDKSEDLLVRAQDICRREILRRLREGKSPDWNDIVFGEPEGLETDAGSIH